MADLSDQIAEMSVQFGKWITGFSVIRSLRPISEFQREPTLFFAQMFISRKKYYI